MQREGLCGHVIGVLSVYLLTLPTSSCAARRYIIKGADIKSPRCRRDVDVVFIGYNPAVLLVKRDLPSRVLI